MPTPIGNCMKRGVVCVTVDTTLNEAAQILVEKHVGMLPVVDNDNKLVGMLELADLLTLFLPDFVSLIDNVDFVHDFGALEDARLDPAVRQRPISEYMRDSVSVEKTAGLLRAYTMMLKHDLHDLPIVTPDGRLAGIASRVDIGTAFLSRWKARANKPEETT